MTGMRKRLARALLKTARRLDPPPCVNYNISALNVVASEEQLAKARRAYQRMQAKQAGRP